MIILEETLSKEFAKLLVKHGAHAASGGASVPRIQIALACEHDVVGSGATSMTASLDRRNVR